MLVGSIFSWSVPGANPKIMTSTAIPADRGKRIEAAHNERQQRYIFLFLFLNKGLSLAEVHAPIPISIT